MVIKNIRGNTMKLRTLEDMKELVKEALNMEILKDDPDFVRLLDEINYEINRRIFNQ